MKFILLMSYILLSISSFASLAEDKFYCERKVNNPNITDYNLLYKQETVGGHVQEMRLRNLSLSIDMPLEICELLKNEVSVQASAVEWITIRNNPYSSCKWTSREKRVGFKVSKIGSFLIDGHPKTIWFYPYGPRTEEFETAVTDPEWDDVEACWP